MKTSTAVGALVAVVVLAGGVYLLMRNSAPANTSESTQTTNTNSTQGGTFSGSMQDLAARGGEWKCTVASNTNGTASQGTVYVSGNKMRADFTVSGYEAHMISDGSYSYSWSSAAPQGVKVKVAQGASAGPASGQGVDTNTAYSYNCAPATAEAALFVPPTTVNFMSF